LISGSSQVSYTGLSNTPAGIVSGSTQVSFNGITDKPALVSSSAQIVGYGVFATTGSNQFNGSQAITGSLTVTGQVVAQTLNVQQVTSSIVYSSGSNIFGNTLGNTQQFTGSLQVSGSSHYVLGNVSIGTTATLGNVTINQTTGETGLVVNSIIAETPTLYLRDAGGNGYSRILANNNLVLDASKVGIGTTSVSGSYEKLAVAGGISIKNDNNAKLEIGRYSSGAPNSYIKLGANSNSLRFTNNTDAADIMELTNSGNLGLGVTPSAWYSSEGYKALQVGNASLFGRNSTNSELYLSSNTFENSSGNPTYITSDFATRYAQNDGVHSWLTAISGTAGNAISFTQAMTLTSGGNLGIGTASPTYRTEVALSISAYWNGTTFTGGNPTALSINNTTNGGYDSVLLLQQTDSGGTTKLAGGIGLVGTGPWTAGNNASQVSDMYFLVKNDSGGISERMRIKSSGNVGINTTSPTNLLHLTGASSTPSLRLGSISAGYHYDIGRENATTGDFLINATVNGVSQGTYLRIAQSGGAATFTSDITSTSLSASIVAGRTTGYGYFGNLTGGAYSMVYGDSHATKPNRIEISGAGGVYILNAATFSGNINSNSQITQNGGGVIALYNETNSVYWYMRVLSTYSNNFRFNYNGTDKAEINNSTGVYTSLSDINKKKDFEYSNIGLNAVMGLKPTFYRMKDDESEGEKELGFIAQEVKEFIPQAYVESGEDKEKFIGLNYNAIVATLVKSVQELKSENDNLKSRLEVLEQS